MSRRRKRRANNAAFAKAFEKVSADTYNERALPHLGDVYSSIRPVAWLDAGLRLNFVGTALLFQVGEIRLLVTAAHVLAFEAKHGRLHVSTPGGPSPIGGTRRWTRAPDRDRSSDPFDLGFVLLDAPTASALEACRHLTLSDVDASLEDPELPEDCLAIGYPANWVSGADPTRHVAIPMLAVGPRLRAADYPGLGVAERVHAETPLDRVNAVGYAWDEVAESLIEWDAASPTAATAVELWMGSPGHRANILDGSLTEIGVAEASTSASQLVVVQVFAHPRGQ